MKKRMGLILAAALVVMTFLSACTTKKTGDDPKNTGTKEEQLLTLNLGSEPTTMDSAIASDNGSFIPLNAIQEGLVRRDKDYKPQKALAENWTISSDALTYTFTLRKGIKWSDGKPITSKDFKYAWVRALDPNTASEYAMFPSYIKGGADFAGLSLKDPDFKKKYDELKAKVAIETPNDETLKVVLEAPTPYFVELMAFPTFFPQRQDLVEQWNKDKDQKFAADADKNVYSGPFVVKEWKHDDSVVLTKNANYWDASNVKLDTIKLLMIKDVSAAVQAFETGKLDRTGLNGTFVAQYRGKPGFVAEADMTTWWLNFNPKKNPALANVNFRKAFSAALDRDVIAKNVLGNGSIAANGLVPSTISGGSKPFRELAGNFLKSTADKADAQKYWDLAKAELKVTEVKFKLLTNDDETAKTMAEATQAMVKAALPGVTLDIEMVTPKDRLAKVKAMDYEMVFAGWGADYNDPMTFMDLWTKDSAFNRVGYNNPAYDALILKAQKEPDAVKRIQFLVEAEKTIMNDMPILPVYHAGIARVIKPWVKNVYDFTVGTGTDLKWAYIEGRAK